MEKRIEQLEGQLLGLATVVALMLQRSPEAREEVQLGHLHQTLYGRLLQEGLPEGVARAAQSALAQALGQGAPG